MPLFFKEVAGCYSWSSEKLHLFVEKQVHTQRVTSWREFWAEDITEPSSFENAVGRTIIVDGTVSVVAR